MKTSKTIAKKAKKAPTPKGRVTRKMPNAVVNNRSYEHSVTTHGSVIKVSEIIKRRMNELGAGPSEVGRMSKTSRNPKGVSRSSIAMFTTGNLDLPIEKLITLSKALNFNIFKELSNLLEPVIKENKVNWILSAEGAKSPKGKDSKKFLESIEKAKQEYAKTFAEISKKG